MGIDELVEQIRLHINDYKFTPTPVVGEIPGEGKDEPHPSDSQNQWNSFATGLDHEEFLTKSMPLVSGEKVLLKAGRWTYDFAGQFPDDYTTHTGREFLVDYYRGMFMVPSGATAIPSGEKVLLSYAWWEDQEYRFGDNEVKSWILDGDAYIRERLTSLSYSIAGRGAGLTFVDAVPSGIQFSLLALTTSYFLRRRLQEEGIQDGIFIKDGDTSFDTTKTLVHRGRQLVDVKKDIDAIIMDIKMGELSTAGVRIDTYSTRDSNAASAYDMETNVLGDPFTGGAF